MMAMKLFLRKVFLNIKIKKILICFDTSYKEMVASRDFSSLFYQKDSYKFNLIKQLLYKSPQFVYKFLVSEISLDTRLDMFAYVMGSYKLPTFLYFLQGPSQDYLSKEEYQKAPSKIQEILEAFNRNECKICRVQDLIDHLLQDNQLNYIRQLQDYGIDFNSCYWKYSSVNEDYLDGKLISTVGVLVNREKSLSSIQDLYEDDSYLKVDSKVRNNNDLLILNSLSSREICNFTQLSHFEVTEEKVRFLASILMKDFEDYSINSLNGLKETFSIENKQIADIIIRKSRNKEEYKKMTEYANLFMELTNLGKEIARRKEKEEKQVHEKQLLEQKRQEFTTLLYNMNEYAQENIPSRTLVKNIRFGE